ncbi:hypothetical protein [Polymorphospora rubra]|uniref:Polyketide cyclase / dehydrase and lipid transport n=1 Tax=Polymorphospora rubra TaxID=338584 RepID=A0A810MUW4_9ACTN|nr:hypothetical protein [Polymorphospora rubra]BCJ64921.1 hypothetical protein Prubr_19420 [Polymorphospora rubra]
MTRLKLTAAARPEQVLATVRETFESRDYLWEQTGPLTAVASEGGRPVRHTMTAQRLRVAVRVDTEARRLVLTQETHGAAYAGNDAPVFVVWLTMRFRRIVRAVREDLAAATLR